MEQWHQKLHNNTTPDDVAICEAYLNFLDGGGDAGAYWATLSDAGIVSVDVYLFDFDLGAKKKLIFSPFFFDKKTRSPSRTTKQPNTQDRARLESFDRAITCEPEDFPDKREGLAADLR
jgi:alpha-glucan,water dikinase